MNVLVWFKHDLRAVDHPALAQAASLGPVLPVFVVEPDYWRLPDIAARHWAFTAECLADLRGALAGMGAPLVVRAGPAVQVLEKLCNAHAISRIVSHQETGHGWSLMRDRQVADWARTRGIRWDQVPNPPAAARPTLEPIALRGISGVEPGQIPTARALRLGEDRCAHRQAGGRANGLELLGSFLAVRGAGYRGLSTHPVAGERASSRLSAHLAAGSLSHGEVAAATADLQATRLPAPWGSSLAAFQDALSQREQCRTSSPPLSFDGAGQPQCYAHPTLLRAWAQGETGLPFVDAMMRYLAATGWLNAPMRAMVLAVAAQHLGQCGQEAGTVLARACTDYAPAIHWPKVRQVFTASESGPLRICNPIRQGQVLDPDGTFTRRWLPELATVPDAFLQEPWKWPGAPRLLGRRYPEPVVDIASSVRAMRGARLLRRAPDAEARLPAGPIRRRKPVPGQMSLDL